MEEITYNDVIAAIRQKAKEILPEGSIITLFGSRARGDARPDSDWDLHILIPGTKKITSSEFFRYGEPFGELGWEMDQEINYIVNTFSDWKKKSYLPLYQNISKEGISL